MLNIPVDYFECAMSHHLDGSSRPAIVTLGVRYQGTSFLVDAATLADSWAVTMVQSMADNWTYTGFSMRDQVGEVFTRNENTEGATAHTPTTPNVAFLITKSTGLGGRRNHGRMFVPGVSEQDVDGVGTVVGSKQTELVSNLNNYLAAVNGAHFFCYLLHNGTPSPTAINQFIVQPLAATMRRRMRK